MNASIYLNTESYETWNVVKANVYYDRMELDNSKPGYWINSELEVIELPFGAMIHSIPHIVTFPPDLRGPIYEKAPRLPKEYIESIQYWGKKPKYDPDGRFYQPVDHAYMINPELIKRAENWKPGDKEPEVEEFDAMVSEGIVLKLEFDSREIDELPDNHFVEIAIPVDPDFLADGNPFYDSMEPTKDELIYLKVGDIRKAPGFYMDVIRYELIDYGYYY